MGQYFRFVCLLNDTFIQFIDTFRHEGGSKLLEMCYLNNYYMLRMEKLLSDGGLWHKQHVVLTGDYADNEKNHLCNLYHMTEEDKTLKFVVKSQNINTTAQFKSYFLNIMYYLFIFTHQIYFLMIF